MVQQRKKPMPTFKVERMDEGAKQSAQNSKDDFSEYMWMADIEDFDREVQLKIEEEDYIRSSIELLLDEEERETVYFDANGKETAAENEFIYNEQQPPRQFTSQPEQQYSYENDQLINSMENMAMNGYQQQQQHYAMAPQMNAYFPTGNGVPFMQPNIPQFVQPQQLHHQNYRYQHFPHHHQNGTQNNGYQQQPRWSNQNGQHQTVTLQSVCIFG